MSAPDTAARATAARRDTPGVFEKGFCVFALIGILALAPFPLGSAVSWGAPLVAILVAAAWLAWAAMARPADVGANLRLILVPALLVLAVLAWAGIQILPVPLGMFSHPLWPMTANLLGMSLAPRISIDPWRGGLHMVRLATAVAMFWLAFSLGRESRSAATLVRAAILICFLYAVYGFVLAGLGTTQAALIYHLPADNSYVSGPFMLHNSFATYSGLGMLAAMTELFRSGADVVDVRRGARVFWLGIIQHVFGRGALFLVAALTLFAALVASASRAGFVSGMAGLLALAAVSLLRVRSGRARLWALAGMVAAVAPVVLLLAGNADTLALRLAELADAGAPDGARLALWQAALRMVETFPWVGLGLGSFQDAYPMFATGVLPFVMDKAHCDYLEFAAGVGLPAAFAWWLALAWLAVMALTGVFIRNRHAAYPLLAFGATVLVAVHSLADFSLQIPAIAMLYAVLLGVGVGQSRRFSALRPE